MKFIIIISSLFLSSFLFASCNKSQQVVPLLTSFDDHQLIAAQLGNSPLLELEVVNTPQSIIRGLSGRDTLGANGMLFVFDQPIIPQFWMKEMKFDLDIIWINDMKVVEIIEGIPAPDLNQPIDQLPQYNPSQPINMVLEVEAGKVREWNLAVNDLVLIK